MTSVAAIREKFLQRDTPKRLSTPSPIISSNGVTHSKLDSSDRYSPQHSRLLSSKAGSSFSISSRNSQGSVGGSNNVPHKTGELKNKEPSSKGKSPDSSNSDIARSNSLTNFANTESDQQHKRLNSVGSLSNSNEKMCVVSELKSRFEKNSSDSTLPKKNLIEKHNNDSSKSEGSPKQPVLKLKPNTLILSLNSNHGEPRPLSKDSFQKDKGISKGSNTVLSSMPLINSAKAHQDLSSISTSTSNLSGVSRNSLINELSEDPNLPSPEGTQSSDSSSMAGKTEEGTVKKLCRRKLLSSPHELGPPPAKPPKPPFLKSSPCNAKLFKIYEKHSAIGFNLLQPPKRPPPKPPNDTAGKPLPPLPINEDIYDDSQNEENLTFPELMGGNENEILSNSNSQQASISGSNDELYNDIENEKEAEKDDIYETMEIDPCANELNREGSEKFDREVIERRKQKLDFRDERKEKEIAKIREKFKLTGEEISLGTGSVKRTVRARGSDLSVKEGEKVTIYRMEGNPSGKWLVINEKGKFGYVELSNIQIDPQNVKTEQHGRSKRWSDVATYLRTDYVSDRVHGWISRFTPCMKKLNNQ